MEIKIGTEVSEALKKTLVAKGKTAARFIVTSVGCKGPLFDIELSDKMDGDVLFEEDGIPFVVEEHLLVALKNPVIVKSGDGFSVKRTACGC
ncbi:hypothetical protein [Fusibacter sp. 3D3]|uniref:hypothetical protein n=1 Tax=Fusibacter sp. 3D3 TaxID=1048380 RepID=UPI000853E1EB|nr:hypothetical protein [Fusibacter sp. 3D3]GAU76002.1 hypothetical protein F3D3_0598 [Fusibacter sp. 3D3]